MGREPKEVRRYRKQSGRVRSVAKDKMLPAMFPGLRISKNGKPYSENRRNRSDMNKGARL